MIQSIRRHSRAALLLALTAQLLIAGWWRWPWTIAPIQTPFDFGTGHVVVVSENWRRHGGLSQHFLPVMSIDPDLTEWPYRGPFSQKYTSVPPLAFILHYAAMRVLPGVEPVLLGKLIAQSLIALSTLGAAFFLFDVFGAWATLAGLTVVIWGVPSLLWFANGYFAVNVGLAAQLVFVSWCAAVAARSLRDSSSSGALAYGVHFTLAAILAGLGMFADYLPAAANAIAAAGLLGVAAIARSTRRAGGRLAAVGAAGILLGSLAAGLSTAMLYGLQMGIANYRDMITLRIAQRTGEAVLAEHVDVIRGQMLTAWPPPVLVAFVAMLIAVLVWCIVSLIRRRLGAASHPAVVVLLALAVSIVPSLFFHYRAVNYVRIHWWFAGTWVIGWAMTVAAFVWIAGRLADSARLAAPVRDRAYPLFAIVVIGALVAANVRFASAQSAVDPRADDVRLYRALGRDLPDDGFPLVVTDLTLAKPGLFEDFPYATAYLRRPVLLHERDGRVRLPAADDLYNGRPVRFGGEDVRDTLRRRGGDVYIAYDPDARRCYAADVALSAWHQTVPINVCRAPAKTFVEAPDTVLGPLSAGYPCTGPPTPPAGLRVVSNSRGTVVVSWAPSVTRRTSYIFEAGTTRGSADGLTTNFGRTTSFTAYQVRPGTYYVRVRGKNACGTSDASNELIVVVE